MNGNLQVGRQLDGLQSHRPRERGAPWLAVTGAKGGVGKTLVAVNLALLLARSGQRTLLVDLDPGCGNVDVHLRLPRNRSLDDVLAGRCTAEAASTEAPFGLRVLAGASGEATMLAGDHELAHRTHAAVLAAARDFDIVVCDTGAGLGELALATAARADLTLAIATPDPAALTDAYAQCKVLHQRGAPLPRLLVNCATNQDEAMRLAGRFGAACRRFLGVDCAMLGWLRRDAALERSAIEQRPFAVHGTGAPLAELEALAAAVRSSMPPLPRRAAFATAGAQSQRFAV